MYKRQVSDSRINVAGLRKDVINYLASAISNVGPGLGDIIGPDGNYKNIPDISKWILSFGMLLGRLELFAILVLFFPSFWRN